MRSEKEAEIIRMLKSYKNIMPDLQELNQKVNDFIKLKNVCMDTSKAMTISDMPKSQTNKISDPVGDLVARYDVEMQKYLTEINKLMDKKSLIEKMLIKLEPIEKRAIELKYIYNPEYRCHIWDWIGNKIGYEERQSRRIHDRAIEKMVRWYNS